MICQISFESFCEFAASEHDAPPTTFAFETNIRAETRHRPFVGAAGMLLTESEVVVEAEVGEHIGNW